MIITPNMSLFAWTSTDDDFDHTQLATNFQRADAHNHTPGKGVLLDGTAAIIPGSITATAIEPGSITGTLIATGTITDNNIASGTITGDRIAASTIHGSNIAANTIEGSNIDPATTLNVAAINTTGEGIFIGGVQSGDASHLNQVISYGGLTCVHNGITLQNAGGILINNGDIDITLGSVNLTNGDLVFTTGRVNQLGTGLNQFGGEGVFLGGVQSGDSGHLNQVISYGGMTIQNNGMTINNVGGIAINNGNININTIGSINQANGVINQLLGGINIANGNVHVALGTFRTYNGNMQAAGEGAFGPAFQSWLSAGQDLYVARNLVLGGAVVFHGATNSAGYWLQLFAGNSSSFGGTNHSAIMTNAYQFGSQGGTSVDTISTGGYTSSPDQLPFPSF
jgi:hypothetical protein